MGIETREQILQWRKQAKSCGQFYSADIGVALRLLDHGLACLDVIDRLQRYADLMNGEPGPEQHLYNGLCPDDDQPDSRDLNCSACRLLLGAMPVPIAAVVHNESSE